MSSFAGVQGSVTLAARDYECLHSKLLNSRHQKPWLDSNFNTPLNSLYDLESNTLLYRKRTHRPSPDRLQRRQGVLALKRA